MPITVTSGTPIADINVTALIDHPRSNDLVVWLTSPLGTSVTLHNRSGGAGNYIVTWYDTLTAPDGPGSLTDFICTSPIGVWTLNVIDLAVSNQGQLDGWGIEFR
jgi:subtilisin-like proprotein convertase family protein